MLWQSCRVLISSGGREAIRTGGVDPVRLGREAGHSDVHWRARRWQARPAGGSSLRLPLFRSALEWKAPARTGTRLIVHGIDRKRWRINCGPHRLVSLFSAMPVVKRRSNRKHAHSEAYDIGQARISMAANPPAGGTLTVSLDCCQRTSGSDGAVLPISEPSVPKRFSSPDQQCHDIKRKKHEPCDGQHHEKRRIGTTSLETGTEKSGIGKRPRQ